MKAVHCFGCQKLAKREDCTLRKHRKSGIRRWFHKPAVKPGCLARFHNEEDWEEVDRSLGETTDEELGFIAEKK